jgi:hypothetical protein
MKEMVLANYERNGVTIDSESEIKYYQFATLSKCL